MSWLFSILLAGSLIASEPAMPETKNYQASVRESRSVVMADETERFEQTYALNPTGRVAVSNINGSITIDTWDNNQVRLEVVKTADSKERFDDVEIKIDSTPDSLTIATKYDRLKNQNNWNRNGKLLIDYRLTVPRSAVLDAIETINGTVSVVNATNVTRAKSINGQVKATNLRGTAELGTVNGTVTADFDQLAGSGRIALNTVNGQVNLTVPSDINATLKSHTLNGSITNDFGLPVRKGKWVGRDLYGKIGNGETPIELSSVNGGLTIKRKADGRNPNPVTDLLPQLAGGDLETDSVSLVGADIEIAERESKREIERANRDLAKVKMDIPRVAVDAVRESMKAIEKAKLVDAESMLKMKIDAERMRREMRLKFKKIRFMSVPPVIDKKSESFNTKGVPTVTVTARDAEVSVRGWDKPVVEYTLTRIGDQRAAAPMPAVAKQNGSDVTIELASEEAANCDKCPDNSGEFQLEVFVPKKANLRITTQGEVRLENVSGDIKIVGGDDAINVRESDGKLALTNSDGRVRVIGFRGDVEAATEDGDVSLEGDFSSLTVNSSEGAVVITVPADANATIISNTRSVEAAGLPFLFSGEDQEYFTFKLGNGGTKYRLATEEGRFLIRSASTIRATV